ncbi:TPA: O75 family O-antigen flippase, partial [Escherichia coli]|nr:O75 family O-antigen flippase [Escherichia coli]HDW0175143.1 O75 family O-antigen flippase [Escherichia coli]HDX4192743.1 O75 family O-antigen flippase [Escherichia coli]
MRTKKALHNFKVDLLITFLLVLLGFYIRTVFVSKMGSDITGVMLLFTQLTAYLNLAELGIGIAAASVLYKPLSENEYNKITYIISLLSVIYKYIFVFVLILGVVIGICIYYFIDSVKVVNGVFLYWALFVFNTSLTYSYAKYSTLLTANQRYSAVRKIQGGGKVIIIVFQILILCFTQSFILYLLVETLGIFSQYLIFKKIIGNGNQYLSN